MSVAFFSDGMFHLRLRLAKRDSLSDAESDRQMRTEMAMVAPSGWVAVTVAAARRA